MTKKLTSVFERTGQLAAALTVCLSLAQGLHLAGSARPETSVHVGNEAAQAVSTGQKRALRPITAGMRRPTQTADRDMQLAAFNPAAIAIAPPRDRRIPLEDVMIDVIVAYTKAAAASYRDIVGEVIEPAIEGGNESFRMSGIGHIKLRLVHAYQTDYVESGDQFVHLWRFAERPMAIWMKFTNCATVTRPMSPFSLSMMPTAAGRPPASEPMRTKPLPSCTMPAPKPTFHSCMRSGI